MNDKLRINFGVMCFKNNLVNVKFEVYKNNS